MRHDLSSSRSGPPFPLRPPRFGGERALLPFVWLVALAGGAVVAVAGPKWGPFLVAGACLLGLVSAGAWRRPDAALAGLALLIPLQVRLNLPGNWSLAVGFVAISGLAAVVVYRQLLNADPGSLREPPGVLPPATLPAPHPPSVGTRGATAPEGQRSLAGGETPGGPAGAVVPGHPGRCPCKRIARPGRETSPACLPGHGRLGKDASEVDTRPARPSSSRILPRRSVLDPSANSPPGGSRANQRRPIFR
jgi:hypothetical protein